MPRSAPPPESSIGIRLFDYLRAQDPGIPDMPVIVADAIARQIDALPDTGGASPPASSYGTVAPPFPEFFIEADTIIPDVGLVQRGVIVKDLSQDWQAGGLRGSVRQAAPPDTHWLLSATGYLRSPAVASGRVLGYVGVILVHLDRYGYILDDTNKIQVVSLPHQQPSASLQPGAGLPSHAPYMLKAIQAMHQRCDADKVSPPRQQRRAAERQGVRQLHDYYILRVKPLAAPRSMAEVGRAARDPGQRREHIVRGHFRYYSPERPLFGRWTGMIWIPAHERGDSDIGRIKKDYKVE